MLPIFRQCGAVSFGLFLVAMAPGQAQGQSNSRQNLFNRPVVVGDSLSAGFQNFSLFDSDTQPGAPLGGQKHGYATLVAQQAGSALALPLISFPGVPPTLTIDQFGNITRGTIVGLRENPLEQTFNLSVPGFTVADALSRKINTAAVTDPIDALALQVLGFPGLATHTAPCGTLAFQNGILTISEVACAVKLKPSLILVSIGNNDALGSLTFGTPPTNPIQFAGTYATMLVALKSTGAKIVVFNIADVSVLPFLVPAPGFQAACGFLPPDVSQADFLVPNIVNPLETSFNICANYAIRSADLIQKTKSAVQAYNGIIAALARQLGVVVVDVNGLYARIAQNGYPLGGTILTNSFLGGLFSLDGIHPTNTGYAILANEVIRKMNSDLHTAIPLVSVQQVALDDPLVLIKP